MIRISLTSIVSCSLFGLYVRTGLGALSTLEQATSSQKGTAQCSHLKNSWVGCENKWFCKTQAVKLTVSMPNEHCIKHLLAKIGKKNVSKNIIVLRSTLVHPPSNTKLVVVFLCSWNLFVFVFSYLENEHSASRCDIFKYFLLSYRSFLNLNQNSTEECEIGYILYTSFSYA